MDAASYRVEKAQSGKPVSSAINAGPETPVAFEQKLPTTSAFLAVSAAEGYERWAPTYDHTPNPLLAREERYLLPLLTNLNDRFALDLACGTGRWLKRLIGQGARHAVGVDQSSAMLRIAGQDRGVRQRLIESRCERLPFPSAVFDLAIFAFALGHAQDLNVVECELSRVTKTSADVFVSDLHPEGYAEGWRVGFRDGATAIQIEMRPRPAAEIVETFCSHGFRCHASESLRLGEPEKEFFLRAGKDHSFAESCQLPAVLVCHFQRLKAPAGNGRVG